jgi:hypothetical protein
MWQLTPLGNLHCRVTTAAAARVLGAADIFVFAGVRRDPGAFAEIHARQALAEARVTHGRIRYRQAASYFDAVVAGSLHGHATAAEAADSCVRTRSEI